MIRFKRYFTVSLALAFLFMVSCSGPGPSTLQSTPGANGPAHPPEIPVHATLKLGSFENLFQENSNASCLIDTEHGEAVIIFTDLSRRINLSIRLSHLDLKNNSYTINPNISASPSSDSLLISLGENKNKDHYRLATVKNAIANSNCQLNYGISQGASVPFFTGQFQCVGLTNLQGQTQSASGEWACKIQSGGQWQW